MAIERLFGAIKQEFMVKASALSDQSAKQIRDGDIEGARESTTALTLELDKMRAVDDVLPLILQRLSTSGVQDPPVSFLYGLVSKELSSLIEGEPKRAEGPEKPSPLDKLPELQVLKGGRAIEVGEKKIKLGPKERELIAYLSRRPNGWFQATELKRQIWGDEKSGSLVQTVNHLRKKLGESAREQNIIRSTTKKSNPRYKLAARLSGFDLDISISTQTSEIDDSDLDPESPFFLSEEELTIPQGDMQSQRAWLADVMEKQREGISNGFRPQQLSGEIPESLKTRWENQVWKPWLVATQNIADQEDDSD